MISSLQKRKTYRVGDQQIFLLEVLLIVLFCIFPLFKNTPANGTTYLSWEGAYRLYLGQIPYRDFGMPLGFAYWVIPAIFFKLFGPFLATLIKAQVFINLAGAFALRSILNSFRVTPAVRMFSVLIFLISFVYINDWPWYNNTVIAFELIGFAFLLDVLSGRKRKYKTGYLLLSAFFMFLSFFTKQDSGGIALLLSLALLTCNGIYEKKFSHLFVFIGFYIAVALLFILPFIPYRFGYWFDYGQSPHTARISFYDIFNLFLSQSQWLKFYLLVIVLMLMGELNQFRTFISDKQKVLFMLFTLGILFQAAVIQVTSYVPKDGNIFFHSFAIAFIASEFRVDQKIQLRQPIIMAITGFLIFLWWSAVPWALVNSILLRHFPDLAKVDPNEISIRTYKFDGDNDTPQLKKWTTGPWKEFRKVRMTEESVDGINRLLKLKVVRERGQNFSFLNMSELTPLENMFGVKPETGSDIPLWYHKNVGMFEREINMYESRIQNHFYDLVLFEYFPTRNNFYPFEIRDVLKKYYFQIDSIPSPRGVNGIIEVFVKKGHDEAKNHF